MGLAAHLDRATFTAGAGLDYGTLVEGELSEETRERFAAVLRSLGLEPEAYYLLPVHPWQWWSKLAVTFAGEPAERHLVVLGEGEDACLAQQSIRTFFNTDHPEKHYVKTALSVLNMGFMRGLSAAYMEATPAVNDGLAGLIERDSLLRGARTRCCRRRSAGSGPKSPRT